MTALSRDALMPREPRGLGPGLALALLVHVGLVIALAFGVSWRTSEPEGIQAELWAAVPQAAAPRAIEPETAPPPPLVRLTPPRPQTRPDAQIAIEKEKAKEKDKARREKLKDLKEQEEKDQQERLKQEQLKKTQADKKELERKRREEVERSTAQLEAQREANLQRILGQAGATGGPGAKGTAAQSKGPSAGYAGRIVAYLKPQATFTETAAGNPKTEVEVRLGPTGNIVGTRITRSSGVPSWDQAVLRALEKAERLPLDDGVVRSPILITWGPND